MHLHNNRQALRAYLCGAFLSLGLFALPAWATHPLVSLDGSDFEIEDPGMPGDEEPGANIRLDDLDMIDWADASGALTSGVDWKPDENIIIGNKNDDTAFG
ncbi:hypothetical protein [Marinobacterium aestuariivivens]|uniref:Uncharacterized protein n=1 Tax=Marinobacterium aestuariivivens TaxID=1698799 RepID=A0ABW1ZUW0_9GAMM